MLYTYGMKKSLLETNPFLKDDAFRKSALARNIESSSAIEGIFVKRDAATGRFVETSTSSKAARINEKKVR